MASYQQLDDNHILFDQTIFQDKESILPIFLEIFMRLGWEIIAIDPSNIVAKTPSKWKKKSETYAVSKTVKGIHLIAFDELSNRISLTQDHANFAAIVKDYEFMVANITDEQFRRFEQEYGVLLSISKENDQSLAKWVAGKSPEQINPSLIEKLLSKLSF